MQGPAEYQSGFEGVGEPWIVLREPPHPGREDLVGGRGLLGLHERLRQGDGEGVAPGIRGRFAHWAAAVDCRWKSLATSSVPSSRSRAAAACCTSTDARHCSKRCRPEVLSDRGSTTAHSSARAASSAAWLCSSPVRTSLTRRCPRGPSRVTRRVSTCAQSTDGEGGVVQEGALRGAMDSATAVTEVAASATRPQRRGTGRSARITVAMSRWRWAGSSESPRRSAATTPSGR